MFTSYDSFHGVEPVCYERGHQEKVLAVIASEFEKLFAGFVDTEAGQLMSEEDFIQLQTKYKVVTDKKKAVKNRRENIKNIIQKSIDEFEKNRQSYIDLFDPENLEEDGEDPPSFKSKTLKNDCPIIRITLNTDREELKQYKKDFKYAAPQRLYDVVVNLSRFSRDYAAVYNEEAYQKISSYEELNLSVIEESGETYAASGVIGGGIRSHMLYKNHPECFPNRSQWALWALWYLTNQENFGCETDSEFLMVDTKWSTTSQNYYYPYDLFAFYAFNIYKMLDGKAKEMDAFIDPKYKYVIVDAFLNYIADQNIAHISELRKQIKDGGQGNA